MHRSTRLTHSLALLAAPLLLATPLIGVRAAVSHVQPHATVQVAIQNFAFSPQTLTVTPGTTVVWTQKDSAPHTVTSDTGAWTASADLSSGQTFSHTFTKTGTFAYHCAVHPNMTATIIVSSHGASGGTGTAAGPAKAPSWVTTTGKVVHLTLISGWNNVDGEFNFNGAAHGGMVVTVPLGDKVVVAYTNAASVPHNVDIIRYQTPLPSKGGAPAFPGATTFKPGTPVAGKGVRQTATFVASKAGRYMIICGVPGHAAGGMWDTFVVSPTAKAASVTFKM
jgi:sulfocyanin